MNLTYKDSGVDIAAGDRLVEKIKPWAQRTRRTEVIGGIGGFAGLFEVPKTYEEPVLVSGTDGVGTKLKLAIETQKHDTIGIDLVAMCVNDILVQGAEPLFFLDYYATGKLNVEIAAQVVKGITEGCLQSGMALLGGETAEMPGLYADQDYDLAGFCVGIIEKKKIIDATSVRKDDRLIAIASSGPHANGYALIRKVLSQSGLNLNHLLGESTLIDLLLEPTKIYVQALRPLFKQFNFHALAHITGGGLIENIPRVIPNSLQAVIHTSSWSWPPVFKWLQNQGGLSTEEMYHTFNCGVGMILCLPPEEVEACLQALEKTNERAWEIGTIETRKDAREIILKP